MKFDNLEKSKSVEISEKIKEKQKNGEKIYNLSIGDVHFDLPKFIIDNLNNIDKNNHYTNSYGDYYLRKEIVDFYYNNHYTVEQCILTPGGKQALFYLISSLDKEKTFLLLEPTWLGYKSILKLLNREIKTINTYKYSLERIKEMEFDGLIICNPNNPDGKIIEKNKMNDIIEYCQKQNKTIILDTVYKHYSYEKEYTEFIYKYNYENFYIIDSFSKTFSVTGLRLGYLLTKNNSIKEKVIKLQQNIATCPSSISQFLLKKFSENINVVNEFRDYYKKNLEIIKNEFENIEVIPEGTFYYFMNLKKYGIKNASEFSKKALEKFNLAVVPGSAYGDEFDSYIRISFSKDRKEFIEAINVLKEALMGEI
jgi:aspartate/methionine/tyrosine aminotransferase